MKASDLLIKCLEADKVEYIFGIPGEETLDLMESLKYSNIKFITTRHEQGAAFMANVYGRLTGNAGVCLATLGPGATNLITGIADANLDRAPVVAITGQTRLEETHKESHQYIDIATIFKSITKWNHTIELASAIPEIVRKAFKIAETEKPGATHIEVPCDVAREEVNGKPLPHLMARRPAPDRDSLVEAARLIEASEYPIILAGNGVIRGHAEEELKEFAEQLKIPVTTTFMGEGAIPYNNEYSLLSIGLQERDYVYCGFEHSDLVIAVGYDFVEYAPSYWNPYCNKKVIHIDSTTSEVDINYPSTVEIIADIKISLQLLRQHVKKTKDFNYVKTLRKFIIKAINEKSDSIEYPIKPQKIIHDVRKVMGKEDILISDVGAHKIWIARMYHVYKPNTVIISNGYSSMGIAIPGALAAKLIYPEKNIMAVCGDGGFLMSSQELETAVRLKLPFVTLIFNDGQYGLIKWKQLKRFGREFGVSFNNPDFVKYAEAFGAKGYRVEKTQDLVPIMEDALNQKVPSIIDVPVDYSENLKLTEKLGKIICPI
ncbi:MAG TPA: acetolactate synthase large subunit [Methanosarcinales archaeon]|nr:acetolactate synthase large subunit [Methanosarcinales archaeon]